MFAGKDFLRMQPPKNYKPGIGRGALGFSTRGNLGFDATKPVDDDGAAAIYASIDNRRRKIAPQDPQQFEDAPKIAEDAWLAMPEAKDTTWRNKRLRLEQQMQRRSYNLPDSMVPLQASQGPNFAQLTRVDPGNPDGWIGYAQQEHDLQHYKKARSVIAKGCQKCPQDPQVWLKAVDFASDLDGKRSIIAKALEAVNSSVVWARAIEMEPSPETKLKVVHRALESNPTNQEFWVLAAQLEPDLETRALVLQQAVELVPQSQKLWLLYYESSPKREIIDKSLERLPESVPLWSAKLELEPADGLVAQLPPGDWAPQLKTLPPATAKLIIDRFSISPNELEGDLKQIAFELLAARDASAYKDWAQQGNAKALEKLLETDPSEETYRLLLQHDHSIEALERAYKAFPAVFVDDYISQLDPHATLEVLAQHEKTVDLWIKYARMVPDPAKALELALEVYPHAGSLYLELYKTSLTPETLAKAVEAAPDCPQLWVEYASSTQNVAKQRAILVQGMAANPRNELIWVERVLVDKRAGKDTTALLATALKECETSGRLWYLYLESLDGLKRKPKYADALLKTGQDPHVLYSLAKFYETRGKDAGELYRRAASAREWVERVHGSD